MDARDKGENISSSTAEADFSSQSARSFDTVFLNPRSVPQPNSSSRPNSTSKSASKPEISKGGRPEFPRNGSADALVTATIDDNETVLPTPPQAHISHYDHTPPNFSRPYSSGCPCGLCCENQIKCSQCWGCRCLKCAVVCACRCVCKCACPECACTGYSECACLQCKRTGCLCTGTEREEQIQKLNRRRMCAFCYRERISLLNIVMVNLISGILLVGILLGALQPWRFAPRRPKHVIMIILNVLLGVVWMNAAAWNLCGAVSWMRGYKGEPPRWADVRPGWLSKLFRLPFKPALENQSPRDKSGAQIVHPHLTENEINSNIKRELLEFRTKHRFDYVSEDAVVDDQENIRPKRFCYKPQGSNSGSEFEAKNLQFVVERGPTRFEICEKGEEEADECYCAIFWRVYVLFTLSMVLVWLLQGAYWQLRLICFEVMRKFPGFQEIVPLILVDIEQSQTRGG